MSPSVYGRQPGRSSQALGGWSLLGTVPSPAPHGAQTHLTASPPRGPESQASHPPLFPRPALPCSSSEKPVLVYPPQLWALSTTPEVSRGLWSPLPAVPGHWQEGSTWPGPWYPKLTQAEGSLALTFGPVAWLWGQSHSVLDQRQVPYQRSCAPEDSSRGSG